MKLSKRMLRAGADKLAGLIGCEDRLLGYDEEYAEAIFLAMAAVAPAKLLVRLASRDPEPPPATETYEEWTRRCLREYPDAYSRLLGAAPLQPGLGWPDTSR